MPSKTTRQRAKRQGKAPTTQAGAYVREEMEHAKRGKHPVKSRKQAIAIGLSKARRSGVKVPRRGARKSAKGGSRSKGRSSSRRSSSGQSRTGRSSRSRSGARRSS